MRKDFSDYSPNQLWEMLGAKIEHDVPPSGFKYFNLTVNVGKKQHDQN